MTRNNIYAQEAGAEVAMIKKLIEKIKFDVKIQLVKGSDAQSNQESTIQLKKLIQECDGKANEIRLHIKRKEGITNIQYFGSYGIMRNSIVISRAIQEIVRIIDAK